MRRVALAFGLAGTVLLAGSGAGDGGRPVNRPRLLVLTDISSLTAGVREPDDGQSLIRLLLYANELELEGLVATANLGHGRAVRPELIHEAIDAYAAVRPNLLRHDARYPDAARLHRLVASGTPVADRNVPVEQSVGPGKSTEGSRKIIEAVDRAVDRSDRRPLWITIWGGSADLAQALHDVREQRTPERLRAFLSGIRVHSISDQDTTGPWIRKEFPTLYYIHRTFGYRGMYRGGDTRLVNSEWVETHIRQGHGALGALYPNYRGGDIWGNRLGPVRGIKEGDTPSFLALLPSGPGDPDHPEWGSWGGRMIPKPGEPGHYMDAVDPHPASATDPDSRMESCYRWRADFQSDFQARLDWCVKSPAEANHHPILRLTAPQEWILRSGVTVDLDASRCADPDGDTLSYEWRFLPECGTLAELPALSGHRSAKVAITAPAVSKPETAHLLLTVRDGGSPSLARYTRFTLQVLPPAR